MKQDRTKLFLLGYLLVFFCIIACRNDKNAPDASQTDAAEGSERIPDRDGVLVDSSNFVEAGVFNPRNSHWYTYRYIEQENAATRALESAIASDSLYEISEMTRLPIFNKNCLSAEKPEECSNEAVIDWMRYAVERPQAAAGQKKAPIHWVTFVIDERGKVTPGRIIPSGQRCEPCEAATKEAIRGMPNWMPALRDGQPVKVRVMLPVYYD